MEQAELACKIMQLAIDNNTNKVDKANAIVKATKLIETYRKEQLSTHVVSKSLPCEKCKTLEVIIKNGLDAKDLDNDCT